MQVSLIYYLTAILLGGFHALEPGHGKTVVAAYLIGSKGRKIDAVLLGIVVTLTHTFSVILLAIAAKIASTRISLTDESLHGYLGLVAGLLILAVGIWMLICRIRGKELFHFHSHDHGHVHSHDPNHTHNPNPIHGHSHPHQHSHEDDEHARDLPHDHGHGHFHDHSHDHSHDHNHDHNHDHSHDHSHDHNYDHSHDHDHNHNHDHNHANSPGHGHDLQGVGMQGEQRVGYWQLFLLGVSGGLVPCPAAIAILLAAVGSGRLGEGLTYILLFSLGLAAVLIAIGIAVVTAGKLASRFLDAKRFARKMSIGSAALITLIGLATLVNSIRHVI
jgi:nickel/cobalt exporter